jgi:hypothetical protein
MRALRFFLVSIVTLSSLCLGQDHPTGALVVSPAVYNTIGSAPLPMAQAPSRVDLSDRLPPVGNQFRQNSCVAWASAYAAYTYFNCSLNDKCRYFHPDGSLNTGEVFSPSFVYNQINRGQDNGSYFTDAFRLMQNQGVPTLAAMGYSPGDWFSQPSLTARQEAANYRIDTYRRLGDLRGNVLEEAKAYLAKGFPVIASVKVDGYLRNQNSVSTPYVWRQLSGPVNQTMAHAILIVGYDDISRTFKFVNSYGTAWGNQGFGHIAYNLFPVVVNEAYIIKPSSGDRSLNSPLLSQISNEITPADRGAGLDFQLDTVEHVFFNGTPSPAQLNQAVMTFKGSLSIPQGFGRTAQVVVYFYLRDGMGRKGRMVTSAYPNFRTARNQAVTATPPLPLDPLLSTQTDFWATMPYSALRIPRGYPAHAPITTLLLAETVLLVDGFPVRMSRPHPFFVRI